eukprot:CAMPEP_0183399906 /NCGR_PEP_ID=MMETSP0370-20130417/12251_1 /TAXON_ID=268820 /ORGANISM="Peridinium aciculiferum, Strain PAER-2" /LENGTH=106 /DNA_ID=CAMNT_0025581133 /DNA_START=152 /DNA_END=472 /DNA_ORIENTATION=-
MTRDVVQDPAFVLRVRRLSSRDVNFLRVCIPRAANDHDPSRLLHEVELIGGEHLPTAPNPAVDVDLLVANDEYLVRLCQCLCEWGVAWIIAGANLDCNQIRVCALN